MPAVASRWPKGSGTLAAVVAASIAALIAFAPARQESGAGAGLPLTAALPERVPPGVVLRVGDPVTR